MRLTKIIGIVAMFGGISIATVLLLTVSQRGLHTELPSDKSVADGDGILRALPTILPKILGEKKITETEILGSPLADVPSIPKRMTRPDDTRIPTILLSLNRSVFADVRGNLGPPSVVTQESVSNWLTDRWQGISPSLPN